MKIFIIKVPRRPGRTIRVILADRDWVARSFGSGMRKGYEAAAWFQASKPSATRSIGTIALSSVSLNLISHECCHAAHHLARCEDEELICLLTGELTEKVWARLESYRGSL